MMGQAEEDSLAALPAWRTLRDRLPKAPLGLIFVNIAEQSPAYPPSAGDTSPGTILNQHLPALALAAVPEQKGMRVEIVGAFEPADDLPPVLQAVLDLPAIEAAKWTSLPADTALALLAHDAPALWPWLEDMLGANGEALDRLHDVTGLDLEADLVGAGGPLANDFSLAITPPLPDQPVGEGLAALQALIAAQGATQAQADDVQAAMEGRGALFGPGEVEGLPIQTQAGTAALGYAISYGLNNDLLLLGTSPDVIGQAMAAKRENHGLVQDDTFQTVLDALPDELSLVFYIDSDRLRELAQANMTAEEYQERQELVGLEAFEAVGVGLQFQPDLVDGTVYFLVP
jgi:hypothetical protein